MHKGETSRRPDRKRAPGRARFNRASVPIARALSKLGVTSRAEAIRRVLAGDVRVDGIVVRDPGFRVAPERAVIHVDGIRVHRDAPCTIALHKPRGVVTTRSDPHGRPTVYDLVRDVPRHVVPVGRLDMASTGLLLMTNDTQFAQWLLDPAHAIPRVYVVTVRGELPGSVVATLTGDGIRDRGENLRARRVEILKSSRRETHVRVTLTEGKNRELRRLFAAVGHDVTRLMRVSIGGLTLGVLAAGRWKALSDAELRRAFPGAPLRKGSARDPGSSRK